MGIPSKSLPLLLLLRAYFILVETDLLLASRGLPAVHRSVKRCATQGQENRETEETVCQAMDIACAFYFKQVLCLQRAAATTILLRQFGVPAEMVIGAQLCPFRAHAWVEVGGRVANDKPYTAHLYRVLDRC